MTLYYPAIIRNKTSEGYRVDFLDLDDCYGVGPTEEEALADARYNAINWIQLELEDTNDLPPHTVQADVDLAPGEKFIDMMIIMPREGWDE